MRRGGTFGKREGRPEAAFVGIARGCGAHCYIGMRRADMNLPDQ
jgi:hypothetical protein